MKFQRSRREERFESVVTAMTIRAALDRAWDRLLFYEELPGRPPLLLRLLLPVPIRTEGEKSRVGDEVRCVYENGDLVKRITLVERCRSFEFEITAQRLAIAGGIRLSGGSYSFESVPGGRSRIRLETRYSSPRRPAWLWRPLEAAACHAFHRHLLGEIRRDLESEIRIGKPEAEAHVR